MPQAANRCFSVAKNGEKNRARGIARENERCYDKEIMNENKKIGVLARLALLSATLIWGSSFVIMKNTVDAIPPHCLLAIRFTAACLLLALVFHKRLPQINKAYLKETALIGLCLFAAYSFQTTGLTETTPGKNAFLTAVYCVIVPFLYWVADKKRPALGNLLAAFLCLGGIGLVSLTQSLTIGVGDSRTLIGGLFFAGHMVCVTMFSRDKDPILITILQFAYCAVFSWLTAFFTEPLPVIGPEAVSGLVYLAVGCTAVALGLQNFGQKYVPPSQAALILSLEAVFGVFFSVLLYHERISPRMGLGFLLIFASILLSETWPALCRRFGLAWPVPAAQSAPPAGGIVSAADGNTAVAKK